LGKSLEKRCFVPPQAAQGMAVSAELKMERFSEGAECRM
jgi:hypothetical protein